MGLIIGDKFVGGMVCNSMQSHRRGVCVEVEVAGE